MSKKNYVLEALEKSLNNYKILFNELEANLNCKYDSRVFALEVSAIQLKIKQGKINHNTGLKMLNNSYLASEKERKIYDKYHGSKYLYYLDLKNEYLSAIDDLQREINQIKFYAQMRESAKLNN